MNIQKISKSISVILLSVSILALMIGATAVEANIDQTKLYKKVYPESKPKCTFCHLDKIPKKGEGEHEFNAYGQKVKAIAEVPTEETYKEAGSAEDVEAGSEAADMEESK